MEMRKKGNPQVLEHVIKLTYYISLNWLFLLSQDVLADWSTTRQSSSYSKWPWKEWALTVVTLASPPSTTIVLTTDCVRMLRLELDTLVYVRLASQEIGARCWENLAIQVKPSFSRFPLFWNSFPLFFLAL
jgi:hypothetical protein